MTKVLITPDGCPIVGQRACIWGVDRIESIQADNEGKPDIETERNIDIDWNSQVNTDDWVDEKGRLWSFSNRKRPVWAALRGEA